MLSIEDVRRKYTFSCSQIMFPEMGILVDVNTLSTFYFTSDKYFDLKLDKKVNLFVFLS